MEWRSLSCALESCGWPVESDLLWFPPEKSLGNLKEVVVAAVLVVVAVLELPVDTLGRGLVGEGECGRPFGKILRGFGV